MQRNSRSTQWRRRPSCRKLGQMSGDTTRGAASWPNFALPHGTTVNGYRIERVLGSGGFGVTYLARDLLQQPFAIKEYYPRQFAIRQELSVLAASAEDEAVADLAGRAAMAAIASADREILVLHYWDGLDVGGVSIALGITENAAGTRLSRAKARFVEQVRLLEAPGTSVLPEDRTQVREELQ